MSHMKSARWMLIISMIIFGTILMFLMVYTFINCDYFHPILNILFAIVLGIIVYLVVNMPSVVKLLQRKNKKVSKIQV